MWGYLHIPVSGFQQQFPSQYVLPGQLPSMQSPMLESQQHFSIEFQPYPSGQALGSALHFPESKTVPAGQGSQLSPSHYGLFPNSLILSEALAHVMQQLSPFMQSLSTSKTAGQSPSQPETHGTQYPSLFLCSYSVHSRQPVPSSDHPYLSAQTQTELSSSQI